MKRGLCSVAAQVPAVKAERALSQRSLTEFLTDLLRQGHQWLTGVYARAREIVREESERAPEQYAQDGKALSEVQRKIDNLVSILADGSVPSAAVRERLGALEDEARVLKGRMKASADSRRTNAALPDDEQLSEMMGAWASSLGEDTPRAAEVLRRAVGTVSAHAVVAPGRTRGYAQLRFRVRAWSALRAATGDRLPEDPPRVPDSGVEGRDLSPEFVLDLGAPTEMDRWAARIAAWRAEGVTWEEIVRRTGLDLSRAHIAWKRHTGIRPGGPGRTEAKDIRE